MFRYRAFGVSFEMPFEPVTRLERALAGPRFALVEAPREAVISGEIIYQSPRRLADGSPAVAYLRDGETDALRFSGAVEFRSPEASEVRFRRLGPMTDDQVEAFALASLIPFRLELEGTIALHCAAIKTAAGLVGFLGNSGAGKSTLAAAELARGASLVSEDVLPLRMAGDRVLAHSGYPEMKLGPEAGEHLFGGRFLRLAGEPFGDKLRIPVGTEGWGEFAGGEHQPKALFIVDRRAGEGPRLERVAAGAAVVELVRYSFHARLVEALGLAGARLEALGRLVRAVPVFRLGYPSGFEVLSDVCDLIESPDRWPGE